MTRICIANLFKTKRKRVAIESIEDYLTIIHQCDKERNVGLQRLENEKIERGIKAEAMRWIEDDIEGPYRIHIMYPFITAIKIYDEATAKYKDCDIQKLVWNEYKRLCSIRNVIHEEWVK